MKILKDIQCNVEYVYGNGNGANSDSCLPQSKCWYTFLISAIGHMHFVFYLVSGWIIITI